MKQFYQIKNVENAIKDVDLNKRTVTGYLSRFGNVDSDGDMIKMGAYTKSVHETGPNGTNRIKFLKNHNTSQLIGGFTELAEDTTGLAFTAVMSTNSHGKDALIEYQEGILTEHSVGFITMQNDTSKEDYNVITEIKLWEGSAVTWGANELTPVTSIKSAYKDMSDEDLIKEFDKITKIAKIGELSDEYLSSIDIKINQLKQIIAEKLESKPIVEVTEMPDESYNEIKVKFLKDILKNGG